MPIYKRCSRCGKRLAPMQACDCSSKRYKEYKPNDISEFYNSRQWHRARELAIEYCFGLDVFSLYHNRIEYGQTVHHIEPVGICYSKRLKQDNLIYLTESNHRLIHKMLDENYPQTVALLTEIRRWFDAKYHG